MGQTFLFTALLLTTSPTIEIQPIQPVAEINQMIALAPAGSEIHFSAGTYTLTEPIVIEGKNGLTVTAAPGVWLDGQKRPEVPKLVWRDDSSWTPIYPDHGGEAAVTIRNSLHIEISGFRMRNNWPNHFKIENSQFIRIRSVKMLGGTNGVFAKGPNTHSIRVENSYWNQDPSRQIWSTIDWQHAHHGLYYFYNGAFFQSRNVWRITIEDNVIKNAFNGIRLKIDAVECPELTKCPYNRDVRILNNRFTRISDNVIEPEVAAFNWTIHSNSFEYVYAPFSLDGVDGEDFAIEQNFIAFRERPRQLLPAQNVTDNRHDNSRLLKLKSQNAAPPPIRNVILSNNKVCTKIISEGRNAYFTDVLTLGSNIRVTKNRFHSGLPFSALQQNLPSELTENFFDLSHADCTE